METKLRKSKPAFVVRGLDDDPSWEELGCDRLPVFPPTIFVMISSQKSQLSWKMQELCQLSAC